MAVTMTTAQRFGDGSYYDYCSEISDETRTEMIDYLVNVLLPKGMFSLIGIDEMVYNGGADEWKAKWVKAIHDKAGEVTTENVLDWIGPTYQLEKELNGKGVEEPAPHRPPLLSL